MAGSTGGAGMFIVGLGLGIACGVALGRLYTPYRGAEVRLIAQERIGALRSGASDTLTELKDRVNNRVGTTQLAAQELVGGVSGGPSAPSPAANPGL
jgi:hypothetical protein